MIPLRFLLAFLLVLWAGLGAASARAQICALPQVPVHLVHAFPTPAPSTLPFLAEEAFPLLAIDSPTSVRFIPGDASRVLVAEQPGVIRSFENTPLATTTAVFLDISAVVDNTGNQQGLFDFVFHPNYASNGYVFAAYTTSAPHCAGGAAACSQVVRYSRSTTDPTVANPASALVLLDDPQTSPYPVHHVSSVVFGPDGYLYVGWGENGLGAPAQDLTRLKGKILRIDPTGGTPYAIPPGNPFVGIPGARPEIYHYGLRHPWRFSWDRATGDLWIADVGENLWEEVDFVPAGGTAGRNFGWWFCEGNHDYSSFDCDSIASTRPILEYPHGPDTGSSVIGGYVYRGAQLPELEGQYVFADFVSGNVWAYSRPANELTRIAFVEGVNSFAETPTGELLLVQRFPGMIYKLVKSASVGGGIPALLSQTGFFTNTATLTPAAGMVEYSVNTPLWSDRAAKRRWIALPPGGVADFHATGNFDFPVRTALVKHFELPAPNATVRRLETRVFVRHDSDWVGYTYKWNAAQTDAALLTDGLVENVTVDFGSGPEIQTWTYPSSLGCYGCHTTAAGRVLGVRTRQLNRTATYPGGTQNQLEAWRCGGLLTHMAASASLYGAYPSIGSSSVSPQSRMRAYLASNCAHCHQPGGPAPGDMDFRFSTLLSAMNAIGVSAAFGDFGIPSARRILPGSPDQSVLQLRQQTVDASLRMPRTTRIPDTSAIAVSHDWIRNGLGAIDSDSDGVPDASDGCPRISNSLQLDRGGFNSTTPDGTPDACQCGDVTGDGVVAVTDIGQLRRWLAGLDGGTPASAHGRCPAADRSGICVVTDWARLARAFSVGPALGQVCTAATEL